MQTVAPVIFVVMLALLPVPGSTSQEVRQQLRLSVTFEHLSCSVTIPQGWRPYKSANGLQYLIPEAQHDEHGTGIYIWLTAKEGKRATKLFDTDELLRTSDGKTALLRYCRAGAFQSIILPTDKTNPCAVAYIDEGDYFLEIVLGTTDEQFVGAKKNLKSIVESYRGTTPNNRWTRGSTARFPTNLSDLQLLPALARVNSDVGPQRR